MKIRVYSKASFIKQLNKLPTALQEEVLDKIDEFKDESNHLKLRVHKLHGRLKGFYSFSVNYKIRIIFNYLSEKEVALLYVGDHSVYE